MKLLNKHNIIDVANKIEIKPSILNAIIKVESAGSGFYLNEGKYFQEIKVLFEPHIFHKFTQGRFDKSHPLFSYPKWNRKGYLKGQAGFGKFLDAIKLDKKAAQLSTSYGLFQIMGFNYEKCGYNSVTDMILDFYEGEQNQLIAFLIFCENTHNKKFNMNLIELLQEYSKSKNNEYLKEFVRNYNGSGQIERYTYLITNNILKYKE